MVRWPDPKVLLGTLSCLCRNPQAPLFTVVPYTYLHSKVQHQLNHGPRIRLVDILPTACQRNRGCIMKCCKTVWQALNDSETACAVWQSIAPPHSDTIRNIHRRTRPANHPFATFPNGIWASQSAKDFILCKFHQCSRTREMLQKYVFSLLRFSYDASAPSISSPGMNILARYSVAWPYVSHGALPPLSPLSTSFPMHSTDDRTGSRTLLRLNGFLTAGAQGCRLAYCTSFFYLYSCGPDIFHSQAQTRGDPTPIQETVKAPCIRRIDPQVSPNSEKAFNASATHPGLAGDTSGKWCNIRPLSAVVDSSVHETRPMWHILSDTL